MTDGAIAVVRLELEPHADPIAGLLHFAGRPATPFSGWMELSQAIELCLHAPPPRAPETRLRSAED